MAFFLQFLTSPFMPARFHLFSHQLKFVEGALRAPLGPPGPGALAPVTPPSRWAWVQQRKPKVYRGSERPRQSGSSKGKCGFV